MNPESKPTTEELKEMAREWQERAKKHVAKVEQLKKEMEAAIVERGEQENRDYMTGYSDGKLGNDPDEDANEAYMVGWEDGQADRGLDI